MSRAATSLYDRQITIFSPEGKLFQVEYAFRAVDAAQKNVVALRGRDCAVLVGQKKISSQVAQDKLLDASSLSSLFHITDKIGGAFVGLPADCRAMVFRSRQKAAEFEYKNGYEPSVAILAQKIANINQVYTQMAYMRLQACVGILIGIDEETKTPSIYKFDPAGWYTGNKAAVVGSKEAEATNFFEKLLKSKQLETEDEVIMNAVLCLQTTMGMDFKASDLEIAVVTTSNPYFRRLNEDAIDHYLTMVAERD